MSDFSLVINMLCDISPAGVLPLAFGMSGTGSLTLSSKSGRWDSDLWILTLIVTVDSLYRYFMVLLKYIFLLYIYI